MNKVMKAVAALMLMTAVVCAAGCSKAPDEQPVEHQEQQKAKVETSQVTNITSIMATAGGMVVSDGNCTVYERGVCWKEMGEEPTINDYHMPAGSGIGSFSCEITGLEPRTNYYVRAYALNDEGISYGSKVWFMTTENGGGNGGGNNGGGMPEGAINGKFTINAQGDQVYFSKGNLQYIGSANIPFWKFADNQWDYFGTTTGQDSDSRYVDRDLFGWGTSGYNNKYPYMISTNNGDYGEGNINISGTQYDWGVYNCISNGGNITNQWRTLTRTEWVFLLETRNTTSGIRYAKAQVNGVQGVVLVPDDWTTSIYALNSVNGGNYGSNTISAEDWTNTMEPNGAVFLPAAGWRTGTSVSGLGNLGCYWTTTCGSGSPYYVRIAYSALDSGTDFSYYGHSVRLVSPVE